MTTAQGRGEPGWYVRELGPGGDRQLWYIAEDQATRMDVTNPSGGAGSFFESKPGETIWQALARMTSWFDGAGTPGPFHRLVLEPGRYHRRIARPLALAGERTLRLPGLAEDRRHIAGAQNQLEALISDLRLICRVVQPTPATLRVHGHAIRNLLILAATEVEMHWRGILRVNGRTAEGGTARYVRLADPLRLRDFTVRFHHCPDIDPVNPFERWDIEKSSQSLNWYSAYNGVKHNREFEFERASLAHALDAVAACAVMLVAQFGDEALTPGLSSFLSVEAPNWPLENMYIPPQNGGNWEPVPCPNLV
ncbi:MAG: hypothetical protein WBR13_11915 [Allosphingosinicella sp.]